MPESARYRKKPVEVEARQLGNDYDEDCAIIGWCGGRAVGIDDEVGDGVLAIDTLEGTMLAEHGDWIIKGAKGEFYPCKPDIFAATYEEVADV
jgi:hypothetical protein